MSAESVITIVRSLVISKKPPCLVTDILRDYREIEGGPLPFQKFGYRNAEEFLASSNSFILDRYGGNTYVTAKASADSAHIQSMVRLQKAAKKKPKAAARFPKSNNSNQNWNRTSYSSVYGQNNSNNYRPSNNRPNYNNRQPLRPAGDRNNNNNNSNGNNNFQNFQKKSQQQNNQQSQSQSQGNKPNMVRSSSNPDSKLVVDNWRNPVVNTNGATKSNSVSGTFSMPEDMRNRLTAANKPPKEKPREEPVKADDLRNKLNAARSVNQEDLRNRLIAKMNNVISNSNSNVPKPQQQQQQVPKTEVQRIQNHHTQEQSKAPIANRLNYMNRIAKANGPAQKQENNLTVIKDYKHYQQKPQKPQPEKPFTFEKSLSPIVQLQEYCIARNLAPPQYQILTYQSRYKCHLVMNNRTYVSDEFGSEMEAKVACSMEAIEEMKAKEAIPLCTDPNYELKIHEKLLQKSGGVFLRGFPQWFETTFQKRIPHNWYQNLQKMPELFTIENSNGDCLIFARVATLSPAVSSSGSSDMEYFASGRISLPFDEKYWNLYITHCKSTVEVWGRIVGMGSSDQFENLMNDIDLHMLTKARRPQSISVGQIYLSSISDCWHRIRVEERKGNMFLCFYIDFGDEEWVDVEKIYVCEPKFLALPPQGIVFSLFGLEDFSGNRCAERILNNKLPNQSLVAEVLTKKEVYEKAFDENCGDYKIQVVLYDTSSNEDVNLNEILVKEICDETPPPVLKSDNSTVNVNVTHIDDKGNLFVQIRNSDWTYVEKLIYELVESKQLKQHKIKKMEISMAGTYLVRSSIHGNFKRAVLHSPPTSENVDTYDMFYVDYGSRANIHISDIYRLESLSAALAKYPSQAIQVKLANLPPITPDLLERIRTLLPSNTSAIIKVVKNAVIQEVLLYSRMDNGAMYTVNDSILIELDLKQNENGTSSTNQQPRKSMKTSSPINYVSVEQKLPDLQDYKLPEINEYMDVLVSMSCNPLNFTVLPYDDNESLDKLMKDMKEHYSTTDEYIPVDVIKKGEAYACKHNNFYHRCIVTQVLPKPHFSLFLCDLGEVIVLSNDYLKTLPTKFRELPKQAMKAKLYGIKPKMNDWTLQDCIDFKENTVNKPFVSKIMNISKDNLENDVTVLELHLIDTSTEDDIYMHQTLIDDGIAIPTNL